MGANWPEVPFSDLFLEPQKNGLTRPKAVRGAGTKMVNMGELFAFDRLRHAAMDRVPLEQRERHFLLRPGDLLFARQSLVLEGAGRCVIFEGDSEDVTFESHIIRVRLDSKRAAAPFYFYWFRSPSGRDRVEAIVTQVAAAGIRGSDLSRVSVPLPPLSTQRTIASVLGTLDDKIELNRRMNETLEELARTIFKSWFVDFDPVRAKSEGRQPVGMDAETAALFPNRLVESELGEIPEGWSWRTVEDVQDGSRGTTAGPFGSNLTRKDYEASGVPVIRGENMRGDGPWFKDEGFVFVSPEKAATLSSNLAHPGDVLFTQRGTLGQVALIPGGARFESYVLSQSQMRLTPRHVPPLYVYLHFSEERTIRYIIANSTAAGVPHINLGFLRKMVLCMPSQRVLEAFRQMTGTLMERLLASSRESHILAELRDLLLPKLISGELRIPTAEKLVEAAL